MRFRFFATTEHCATIEALVGQQLAAFRVPGATGRLNEWLQVISAQEVENIVKSVLASLGDSPKPPNYAPSNLCSPLHVFEEPVGVSPSRLVEAAQYLEVHGLPVDLLRDMHHSPRRGETFMATHRYFSKKQDLQMNNQLYGARLIYVAEQHRANGRAFGQLVQEALQHHPK